MGSGSPELEASLTLGHCIIPFLFTLVVQIGTMQCFYCPQKDVSLVPWDSLSSADQALLRDKYPDAGEGAVCEFCVRSARPSAFFSRRSSGSSSTGPQSVDSRLLVPAVDSVAVSGECEVAESSTSAKESGAQKKPGECEVAESSTSAKESGAQKKPAKPSRPDTLKKAKNPRVLKTVTIAQRVEKYGKYGLYDNNGKLYCKPCGKKMDETGFAIFLGDPTQKRCRFSKMLLKQSALFGYSESAQSSRAHAKKSATNRNGGTKFPPPPTPPKPPF